MTRRTRKVTQLRRALGAIHAANVTPERRRELVARAVARARRRPSVAKARKP